MIPAPTPVVPPVLPTFDSVRITRVVINEYDALGKRSATVDVVKCHYSTDEHGTVTGCLDASAVQAALPPGTVTRKTILIPDLDALAAAEAAAGDPSLAQAIAFIVAAIHRRVLASFAN